MSRHRWPERLTPSSIRARLTLWSAAVVALLLGVGAVASYALLARATMRRLDRSLQETARAFAAAWIAQQAASPGRVVAPTEAVGRFRAGEFEVVVLDQARRVVAERPGPGDGGRIGTSGRDLVTRLAQVATADGALATIPGAGAPRRAFAMPLHVAGRRQLVVVAQGLGSRDAMLDDVRAAYLIALPFAVAIALAGGSFLAARALAPVGALAHQAARIGASTLHERLTARDGRDELGRLTRAFNDLLGRLARAFDQQRQFMADAAHELRTPIAVVRTEADVALSRDDRPPAEYREALAVVRDEARRMSRIIDDLLLLARADADAYPLAVTETYLDDIVAESVRAARTLAAARGITLRDASPAGDLPFRGDEALLRRLVMILLDNAIKYGPPGGEVVARAARAADGEYVVAVRDAGPAIPPDVRDRIFDRFYRVPGDRTAGEDTGAGLGLAIGRWIAAAHGGRLELARSDGRGNEFRVTLPAAARDGHR